MKKKIIALTLIMLFMFVMILTACGNRQILDITYTFTDTVICLPDGTVIKGSVESWKDYGYGDQIQVVVDGVTYLVHSSNIALIKK